MGYTNPDTVFRGTTGAVVPASWTDTVNDDLNALNGTLESVNGSAASWASGWKKQINTVVVSAASGGTTVTYPIAYGSTSLPIVCLNHSAAATSLSISGPSATGFTVFIYNGSTQVTSGSIQIYYEVTGE